VGGGGGGGGVGQNLDKTCVLSFSSSFPLCCTEFHCNKVWQVHVTLDQLWTLGHVICLLLVNSHIGQYCTLPDHAHPIFLSGSNGFKFCIGEGPIMGAFQI